MLGSVDSCVLMGLEVRRRVRPMLLLIDAKTATCDQLREAAARLRRRALRKPDG